MKYYSVECEAPGGGFGPNALLKYNANRTYVETVEYLDLIFDVWLGGELIQDGSCFCVTESLWTYLNDEGVRGVAVRDMDVRAGEHVNDFYPGRVIPVFKQLILPMTVQAQQANGWILEQSSIPEADMFSGPGAPLIVSGRIKDCLTSYGVLNLEFAEASVSNV